MPVKVLKTTKQTVKLAITENGYTMYAKLERQTTDLLIQIIGGDVPHYGVITTVDKTGQVKTTALPSRPGSIHREQVLIDQVLAFIKPLIVNNAVLVSGMHVNQITHGQIQAAFPMAHALGEGLAQWLLANPGSQPDIRYAKRKKETSKL